jgi:hypothetical protein
MHRSFLTLISISHAIAHMQYLGRYAGSLSRRIGGTRNYRTLLVVDVQAR